MLRDGMGFGVNVTVQKKFLNVCFGTQLFLNFKYKDCYSHMTKKDNPTGWESLQIMYLRI